MEYFNVCYKHLLFRCNRVPTIHKMDPTIFTMKLIRRMTYPQTVLFRLREGSSKGNNWIFLAQYTPSPIHLLCPKRNTSLLLLSSMHFFGKQFAKHSKIFWIKNILNKLLFLFDNSKLINKIFYCTYLNQVRNKTIITDI